MTESKTVINKVIQKTPTGEPSEDMNLGVDFDNVIDTRQDKGNHSLAQFFDNYVEFMDNYTFIAKGAVTPANKRALVWIDTAHSNQE